MKVVHGIPYHIRPYSDLRSDVKELCDHAPNIVLVFDKSFDRSFEVKRASFFQIRHSCQRYGQQNHQHHTSKDDIRVGDRIELGCLNGSQVGVGHRSSFRGRQGVKPGQDENLRKDHTGYRSERIERLGEIKSPCGGLLRPYRADIGVRGCLQNRQSREQNQNGGKKHNVADLIVGDSHL